MVNQKILYTLIIFLGHFTFGALSGIAGPSLVDFQYLISQNGTIATIKEISYFMTFSMLGGIAGSFVSFLYKLPFLTSYINRQLLTSLLLLLFGVSFALTPQISTLPSFYVFFFFIGFGGGNWNTVSSTWLMELWSGRVLGSVLQCLQLCYGLGMIAGPIVVKPWLGGYLKEGEVVTKEVVEERRRSLAVPFVVCGALECTVGLLLFLLYIPSSTRYFQLLSTQNQESPSPKHPTATTKLLDCPARQTPRTLFILLLMGVFAFYNLAEANHLNFQNTYFQSLSGPNISAGAAAEIASITATSYTLGRGLSIFTARWITSGTLILAHMTLGLLSFVMLFWTQTTSQLLISINSAFIGFSFSAILPAIFSYVNTYLRVDDHRNAAFFITLALPSVFTPFLLGPYLESFPSILLYLDVASLGLAFGLFILSMTLVMKCRKNQKKDTTSRMLLSDDQTNYGSM